MNFGIIGAGIVGTAMAIRLSQAGYKLVGMHTRSQRSYDRFCTYLEWEKRPLAEWIAQADLLFITTQDGMIRPACEELTRKGLYKEGQIWIHCSGSVSSRAMEVDSTLPVKYLSIHPLLAFAGIEQALELMPGTHFGIEGDAVEVGLEIVQSLGGIPHQLASRQKPLYHAGAVVVSNYLVSLAGIAVKLFEEAGIPRQDALESLLPLMQGTLKNLEKVGLPQALTGPIARGDAEVIRGHLEHMPQEVQPAYRVLGLYTLELAKQKREQSGLTYPQEAKEEIRGLLEGQGGS